MAPSQISTLYRNVVLLQCFRLFRYDADLHKLIHEPASDYDRLDEDSDIWKALHTSLIAQYGRTLSYNIL